MRAIRSGDLALDFFFAPLAICLSNLKVERRLSARVFVVAFLPPDAPDDPEQGGSTQKDEGQKQVESARHVPFP